MDQLPLTCPSPNQRPRRVTDAMALRAAERITDDLIQSSFFGIEERDEIIADLLEVTRFDRTVDGYQIARTLENSKHWECDLQIAECLDRFSDLCSEALRQAEWRWAVENPMKQSFPTGHPVSTAYGDGRIDSIYDRGAHKYVVQVGDRKLIIPFEDVRPRQHRVGHLGIIVF